MCNLAKIFQINFNKEKSKKFAIKKKINVRFYKKNRVKKNLKKIPIKINKVKLAGH